MVFFCCSMATDHFNEHNAQISLVFLLFCVVGFCCCCFSFFFSFFFFLTCINSAGPWQSLLLVGGFMVLGRLFEMSQKKVTKAQKLKKRMCLSRKLALNRIICQWNSESYTSRNLSTAPLRVSLCQKRTFHRQNKRMYLLGYYEGLKYLLKNMLKENG